MNPDILKSLTDAPQVFSGTVMSGAKRVAFFIQLDWVMKQCAAKLGFEPYPGTLNLLVSEPDIESVVKIRRSPGVSLVPPDTSHCTGQVYPVQIGGIPGAMILPEETVRIHGDGVVEILAPICLREKLTLKDGDRITVRIKGAN